MELWNLYREPAYWRHGETEEQACPRPHSWLMGDLELKFKVTQPIHNAILFKCILAQQVDFLKLKL